MEDYIQENDKKLLARKDKTFKFIDKYKSNLVAFAEDFYGIKLYPYQKILLNTLNKVNNVKDFISNSFYKNYSHYKNMFKTTYIEYIKEEKMDFQIWKRDCIEIYEKGKLVKVIKNNET